MARRSTLTDDEILRRARSVFVELGYAARTWQVAAAVGLTWSAIALRFGDKQALFTRAMAGSAGGCRRSAFEQGDETHLTSLLERLSACVAEQWPLRLQCRLAATTPDAANESDGLIQCLGAALEAHAHRGALRSDLGPRALARIVLALLTGEAAQRFVAREPTLHADPGFIDGVVHLLSPASR